MKLINGLLMSALLFPMTVYGQQAPEEKAVFQLFVTPTMTFDFGSTATVYPSGTKGDASSVSPAVSIEGRWNFLRKQKYTVFVSPTLNWSKYRWSTERQAVPDSVEVNHYALYLPVGISTRISETTLWISGGGGLVYVSPGSSFFDDTFALGTSLKAGVDHLVTDKISIGMETGVSTEIYSVDSSNSNASADVRSIHGLIGLRIGFNF